MFSVSFRITTYGNHHRQRWFACLMALAIVMLIPAASMASGQVSLALSSNIADDIEGYRIYYKNGSSGEPYNGSGLTPGDSPLEISASSLTNSANTQITFTGLTPGETYYFVATVYDRYGNESEYSDEVVYSEPDVAALIIKHDITASATGNGTILPAGTTTINEGDSFTCTISADPNHHIADVLVDGVSAGAVTSYTFTDISKFHDIKAIFEADQLNDPVDQTIDDTVNSPPGDTMSAIIVDDGDTGTSSNGNWQISGASNFYGMQSLFSREVGADYTFESQINGNHEVAMWWSGYNTRCPDVPVEIYDGDMLLDVVNVDQSQNSGQWNVLGSYDFTSTARVSVLVESSECSTAADAVRFVIDDTVSQAIDDTVDSYPDGSKPSIIVDDGDTGTSADGIWKISGATDTFGKQSLFSRDVGAEYTYESQISGHHEVAMWWSGYSTRCPDVPVEIYDGDVLLDVLYVDQSLNSGQWNVLGSYDFTGTALVSVQSASSDCSTAADAVKFTVDEKANNVMDDGDSGTSSKGIWKISGATDPFGKQSLFSKDVGAEYTYESQISGYHEVAMWWSGYSTRCPDVPVEIYDGDVLLDVLYVDQSLNSGQWNVLGSYDFTGTARVSVQSASSDCSTAADAVKFTADEKVNKVMDDGDAGTSSKGIWKISGATDPFGKQSLFSKDVGAEYTYESQISGYHEVAMWWSGYSTRCADVPVEIFDDGILIDRVYVDQSLNSGQWNILGSYDFNGVARVRISSQSSACSTSADAVSFSK